MGNPFDDEDRKFRVLVNEKGQYSMWPDGNDVPKGWTSVFGPTDRQSCLDHVKESWSEMSPSSPH